MDIHSLKSSGCLIFECISGSRAYGLDTPGSDTDIRGVFILPKESFYSLSYPEQINNESNDIVYYELRKFIGLLAKNNPNVLELLAMPEECILYKHPLFDLIQPGIFLSKMCENSFVNYAYTQIKKARGLNKKIVNPMEKQRKSLLDFCYIYKQKESVPLHTFLKNQNWKQELCGLAGIPHLKDCYNLFYKDSGEYKGIVSGENAQEVSLSFIPKGEVPEALLYVNKDGYSAYCKEFREYRDWEEKRNDTRYQSTISHQKNYDAKNIMHTYRLLEMAREIAEEGIIRVRRPNRDFLLSIKAGTFEYDELLSRAEEMKAGLTDLFARASLPDQPDEQAVNTLLFEIRRAFYANETL